MYVVNIDQYTAAETPPEYTNAPLWPDLQATQEAVPYVVELRVGKAVP